MHLCSVPLTEDGRLSAKILFNRKSLLQLQSELPKYLQSKGFDVQRGESGSRVSSLKFYIKTNKTENKAIEEGCTTIDSKVTNEEKKSSAELISVVKSIFNENTTGILKLKKSKGIQYNFCYVVCFLSLRTVKFSYGIYVIYSIIKHIS